MYIFLTPIGFVNKAIVDPENEFKIEEEFYHLTPKKFKDIIKYRAGLSQHTQGAILSEDYEEFTDINSLEHSVWYYPGQICPDIVVSLTKDDQEISKKNILFNRTQHFTMSSGKIKFKMNKKIDKLREFLRIGNVKSGYNLSKLLFDYFVVNSRKKYKILILNLCRSSPKIGVPDMLFEYESFIHHINVELFKKINPSLVDKKIVFNKAVAYFYDSISRSIIKGNELSLKDKQFNILNSNYYRFTPNLIRIFELIKEKSRNKIFFLSEEFKRELLYIGGMPITLMIDFLIKLKTDVAIQNNYNFIILNFLKVNHKKLDILFSGAQNCKVALILNQEERDKQGIFNSKHPITGKRTNPLLSQANQDNKILEHLMKSKNNIISIISINFV